MDTVTFQMEEICEYQLLGPVYTKRQHQCCDHASNAVLIETNGVTLVWGCNPYSSDSLFLMRIESLAPLQSSRGIDADAWCKRALKE